MLGIDIAITYDFVQSKYQLVAEDIKPTTPLQNKLSAAHLIFLFTIHCIFRYVLLLAVSSMLIDRHGHRTHFLTR